MNYEEYARTLSKDIGINLEEEQTFEGEEVALWLCDGTEEGPIPGDNFCLSWAEVCAKLESL